MRTLLCLFMLTPALLLAQPIVPLTSADFPNATAGIANTYDITTLLGYNDAADVYIEYGFRSLMVQEIWFDQEKIKVEVALMDSPEAAFGLYSISGIKCLQRDTLTAFDCNSVYQYQAAIGKLFITITSETGSETARAFYLPVARAIMQWNPQEIFQLPVPFNQVLLKKGKKDLVYTEGPIGLQYLLIPWQDLFIGFDFGMYAIVLANPTSDIYFARIRFAAPDGMRRFLRLAGLMQGDVPVPNTNTNDGLYREFMQVDEQTIYFLQSQEPWPINAVINQ